MPNNDADTADNADMRITYAALANPQLGEPFIPAAGSQSQSQSTVETAYALHDAADRDCIAALTATGRSLVLPANHDSPLSLRHVDLHVPVDACGSRRYFFERYTREDGTAVERYRCACGRALTANKIVELHRQHLVYGTLPGLTGATGPIGPAGLGHRQDATTSTIIVNLEDVRCDCPRPRGAVAVRVSYSPAGSTQADVLRDETVTSFTCVDCRQPLVLTSQTTENAELLSATARVKLEALRRVAAVLLPSRTCNWTIEDLVRGMLTCGTTREEVMRFSGGVATTSYGRRIPWLQDVGINTSMSADNLRWYYNFTFTLRGQRRSTPLQPFTPLTGSTPTPSAMGRYQLLLVEYLLMSVGIRLSQPDDLLTVIATSENPDSICFRGCGRRSESTFRFTTTVSDEPPCEFSLLTDGELLNYFCTAVITAAVASDAFVQPATSAAAPAPVALVDGVPGVAYHNVAHARIAADLLRARQLSYSTGIDLAAGIDFSVSRQMTPEIDAQTRCELATAATVAAKRPHLVELEVPVCDCGSTGILCFESHVYECGRCKRDISQTEFDDISWRHYQAKHKRVANETGDRFIYLRVGDILQKGDEYGIGQRFVIGNPADTGIQPGTPCTGVIACYAPRRLKPEFRRIFKPAGRRLITIESSS